MQSLHRLGWRWHTQHLSLGGPDLMQLAVGTKVCSVALRSLPSTANATNSQVSKSESAARPRESVLTPAVFFQILPQRLPHVHFRQRLPWILTRDEHILWNQFLRGLTSHCFCLNDTSPNHSHQATTFHLLVSCQPLPSKSHARSCFSRIL